MALRLPRIARRTHKWLGLIVIVQAVVWTCTGLYMTSVRADVIAGGGLVETPAVAPLALEGLKEPSTFLAGAPGASVKLDSQLGAPVYLVTDDAGQTLFDALSGARLSPLPEPAARARAQALFAGPGRLLDAELEPVFRGAEGPVWRVAFEGAWRPTLYISAQTGQLVAKRHDLARAYDLFFSLHVMDYGLRARVNNAVIRVFTWLAVALAATGGWMLVYSFPRRRRKGR